MTLLESSQSLLLLIDIQEKLTPLVHAQQQLVAHCRWLAELATALSVPILVSEQYPQGLGPTVAPLQAYAQHAIAKTAFSCADEPECLATLRRLGKRQVILAGIESHVCILQTALRLPEERFEVVVVTDAISARHQQDHQLAVSRMQQQGITVLSREMVFFEWLKTASHPQFKALSQQFLQGQ